MICVCHLFRLCLSISFPKLFIHYFCCGADKKNHHMHLKICFCPVYNPPSICWLPFEIYGSGVLESLIPASETCLCKSEPCLYTSQVPFSPYYFPFPICILLFFCVFFTERTWNSCWNQNSHFAKNEHQKYSL